MDYKISISITRFSTLDLLWLYNLMKIGYFDVILSGSYFRKQRKCSIPWGSFFAHIRHENSNVFFITRKLINSNYEKVASRVSRLHQVNQELLWNGQEGTTNFFSMKNYAKTAFELFLVMFISHLCRNF